MNKNPNHLFQSLQTVETDKLKNVDFMKGFDIDVVAVHKCSGDGYLCSIEFDFNGSRAFYYRNVLSKDCVLMVNGICYN